MLPLDRIMQCVSMHVPTFREKIGLTLAIVQRACLAPVTPVHLSGKVATMHGSVGIHKLAVAHNCTWYQQASTDTCAMPALPAPMSTAWHDVQDRPER